MAKPPRSVVLLGKITDIALVASGRGIRESARLKRAYGRARWRKLKGRAKVQLPDGTARSAEVHWYEAHGIGRRDLKIKRLLD